MAGKYLFAILLALAVPMATAHAQDKPAPEAQWRTDYQLARKEALEKKRPILIFVEYGTSPPCQRYKQTTFRDVEVVRILNAEFVLLNIDTHDTKADSVLADYLHVKAYPTIVFATHTGHILLQKIGYVEPAEFREYLHIILAECPAPDWRTNSLPRRTSCYPR